MEETRHRTIQSYLDNPPRHRPNVADFRQIEAEARSLERGDGADQIAFCRLRRETFSIDRIVLANAEDIAQSVIGNDPAFGDPRDDLARRIEPNQPLPARGADQLGARPDTDSLAEQVRFVADEGDVDHSVTDTVRAGRQ